MAKHTDMLTLEDIIGANAALNQLDGQQKEGKDGSFALIPYKFDDATRWNIAKNKRLFKVEAEAYDETRNALIKELSPVNMDVSKEDAATREKFRLRHRELLKKPVELSGLLKIKKSALLKEDLNPIAGSILELLMPILDES